MRYDCSKALDYTHEVNRICAEQIKKSGCENCPLHHEATSSTHIIIPPRDACYGIARNITQESIDIVQKWSDEHPEMTRADVFFKIFPKCRKGDLPCFYSLIGKEAWCFSRQNCTCEECWQKPYRGEFECGEQNQ